MPFEINIGIDINEGAWFDYGDGISVQILPWTRSLIRKTRKEATVKSPQPPFAKGGETEIPSSGAGEDFLDPELWERQIYRNIIKDMKGQVDSKTKKPVPCTDQVKDIVCECLPDFADWAFERSLALAREILEKTETGLKNSKSSPGGRPAAPKA